MLSSLLLNLLLNSTGSVIVISLASSHGPVKFAPFPLSLIKDDLLCVNAHLYRRVYSTDCEGSDGRM